MDGDNIFPVNSSIHNYGRILKISSIQLEDAGIYRCIAGNSLGNARADITVHVESKFTFRKYKELFVQIMLHNILNEITSVSF